MKITKSFLVAVATVLPFIAVAQKDTTHRALSIGLNFNNAPNHSQNVGIDQIFNSPPLFYYNSDGGHTTDKSFSAGLQLNYYLKGNRSVRMRLGLIDYNTTYNYNSYDITPPPNPGQTETATTVSKRKDYYLSLGIEQDFPLGRIVTLTTSLDLQYLDIGQLNYSANYNNSGSGGSSSEDYTEEYPAGLRLGAGPAIGVKFRLYKSLALSAEIEDIAGYRYVNGTINSSDVLTYSSPTPSNSSNASTYKYSFSGFTSSGAMVNILLSLTL